MSYSIDLPIHPLIEWRTRVLPANFDMTGFNWERAPLWGLPEPRHIRGGNFQFSGTEYLILEKREQLPVSARSTVLKSSFTLHWRNRGVKPDKFIKQRIGAFLHARGLPTDSLKGNGQLLACLRIIHATHLGFNLEAFYEELNPVES